MKKLLMLLALASSVFGVGSVSQSQTQLGTTSTWVVAFDWTGDASTGSVPATAAVLRGGNFQGYVIIGAEFVPGTPSPTTLYDITITDGLGVDFLGGGGANLSATVASSTAAGPNAPPLNGTFTLNITNNSVASARGRVLVYFQKPNDQAGIASLLQLARLSPSGASVGDVITLNAAGRWAPGAGGSGAVSSVFSRTGAVVAANGDYTASNVTNVPAGTIAAVELQAAIDELDSEKAPLASPTFTGTVGLPAVTTTDDVRITFNPGANNAGINVGCQSAAPSSPSNGDAYCDSDDGKVYVRVSGAWVEPGGGGTGNAASAVTTTCSGASATFTATSNTINRFDCALVATNVTSSTLASLTSGALYTIIVTQPGGGGITFAAPTGLTGFLPITAGVGDAAGEVCTFEFVATSTTAGRVASQRCDGGTPGVTFGQSTSGTMSYRGPATGTNIFTAPSGTNTGFGSGSTNTATGRQDFSGAASTASLKVGTAAPGTCTVGDVFFDSDATAGSNVLGCTATNTWTAQGAAITQKWKTSGMFCGKNYNSSWQGFLWSVSGSDDAHCQTVSTSGLNGLSFENDASTDDFATAFWAIPDGVTGNITLSIYAQWANTASKFVELEIEYYCGVYSDSATWAPTFSSKVADQLASGSGTNTGHKFSWTFDPGCSGTDDIFAVNIYRDNTITDNLADWAQLGTWKLEQQ